MQSSAQFNYSTAQGDSLFGVSIFSKFEYSDYRERNELLKGSHLMTRGTFFHLSRNSASSCWSIPFFTVERKCELEKREKFEGNIVLYRPGNGPGPQMIPWPEMIPKLNRKWSPDGKWSPHWTANDPRSPYHKYRMEWTQIWTVDLNYIELIILIAPVVIFKLSACKFLNFKNYNIASTVQQNNLPLND